MKTKNLLMLFPCIALLAITGCATTVTREPEPKTKVVSTGIDQKDWNDAAATMIESLKENFINAGKLQTPADKPAMLVISRIVNNTSSSVETDLLIKKIRIELIRTGKVVTSTIIGIGDAEDPIAQEEARRRRLLGKEPSRPDYTLSGKITEQVSRLGGTKDISYTFQLSMSGIAEGTTVWEEERTITKQVKRPGLGF